MKRDIDQKLLDWKLDSSRRVLLVRGARQVGKTYSVRELGKTFSNRRWTRAYLRSVSRVTDRLSCKVKPTFLPPSD